MTPNAHEKPSDALKAIYKHYQKASVEELDIDSELVDFQRGLAKQQRDQVHEEQFLDAQRLQNLYDPFVDAQDDHTLYVPYSRIPLPLSYTFDDFPGLHVLPSLLPPRVQKSVLVKLLQRDLADARHKTNVHFHHVVQYPTGGRSFFDLDPSNNDTIVPKDSSLHNSMSVSQFLNKKLRWMTLGGQYDWTRKKYPEEEPPAFPQDLQELLRGLFPETVAEAAIVNLYSPGDVLSLHRDVSEQCDNGLISISVGCDGIFLVALEGPTNSQGPAKHLAMRLRSGDAVYMSGLSRYAWHGVPQVIPNTCPSGLTKWPANTLPGSGSTSANEQWSSWMASKRINLNVRQMRSCAIATHDQPCSA